MFLKLFLVYPRHRKWLSNWYVYMYIYIYVCVYIVYIYIYIYICLFIYMIYIHIFITIFSPFLFCFFLDLGTWILTLNSGYHHEILPVSKSFPKSFLYVWYICTIDQFNCIISIAFVNNCLCFWGQIKGVIFCFIITFYFLKP